ncbi:MAG: hypothetical protein PF574_03505 [Candidatus Delongbacteria bacterium]|jgi:hypothetical protein|nr:hypothetical protein [Candidatus Delongbacteria bacterium]
MFKLKTLIIAITLVIIMSCTQKNSENSKKNYQLSDTLMTVEKYIDMDFELASTLVEEYYEKLKDKEYAEVKDIYHKFLEEKESIYKKYNVTDPKKNSVWARKNKVELKAYREAHPVINYYKKYPEFKKVNIVIYNLARAEYNSKQTEE